MKYEPFLASPAGLGVAYWSAFEQYSAIQQIYIFDNIKKLSEGRREGTKIDPRPIEAFQIAAPLIKSSRYNGVNVFFLRSMPQIHFI